MTNLRTRPWAFAVLLIISLCIGGGTQVSADKQAEGAADVIGLALNKMHIVELADDVRDVFVGNPEIADVIVSSPRRVYVLGRQVGSTDVLLYDEQMNILRRLDVRVQLDLAPLRSVLEASFPEERIETQAVGQTVFLRGNVPSPKVAESVRRVARRMVGSDENLVNLLDVRGEQQVLLRVRVAEVSRAATKELGIDNRLLIPTFGGDSALSFGQGLTAPFISGNFADESANILADGSISSVADNVNLTIEALERHGLARVLAKPNLTTLSGEEASFLAGGEFPIPISQEEGTITVEFKQFGIRVLFTPVVQSAELISMRIETEVSRIGTGQVQLGGGITIPSFEVSRASTTVELPSGGGLVIAGLLQDELRNTVSGVPGFKDIPILGALFRSTEWQRDETELVITVTPYLVRPTAPESLVLPTDGFGPGSDVDLYLLGRLHARYGGGGETPERSGELQAPMGYIME